MPRNTAVFHATFSGEGVVRVDDITQDPRYGKNPPHNGMPQGHLPVVSYLAVPVVSKNDEVIGGLFFGHADKGVFTAEAEQLVVGVAAQAAIAIENARLIDDLKKANWENQRLLKLAGELDEKKDEFISIASHELKTPLTSIKAYVQLLQREVGGEPGDKPYQYFQKTDNYINKLQALIEDLLNVSKIQAGKLEYNMDSFSINEVVRETVDGFQNTINSHSITLDTQEDAMIYGDKQRLEQVLTNLLSNAVKYSPENKSVELVIKRDGKNVVISVKDYGIGISPEDHPKIFDRFQRVTSDKRFSGLGIGLFISCEIVKRHEGKMWVESKPGEGSTFYFALPVKEMQQPR
ncbi:MAG: hypothetical protein JWN76_1414 [Chitinophagaceae bacterium]|nr:hypothetical protein [Chitinophagaceae bacterium]